MKKDWTVTDGKEKITVSSKLDGMLHLGAKFGGVKYNRMIDEGKITFDEKNKTIKYNL